MPHLLKQRALLADGSSRDGARTVRQASDDCNRHARDTGIHHTKTRRSSHTVGDEGAVEVGRDHHVELLGLGHQLMNKQA